MAVNCQNFMTVTIHNFNIEIKLFVLALGFEGCFVMVQLIFFVLSVCRFTHWA